MAERLLPIGPSEGMTAELLWLMPPPTVSLLPGLLRMIPLEIDAASPLLASAKQPSWSLRMSSLGHSGIFVVHLDLDQHGALWASGLKVDVGLG